MHARPSHDVAATATDDGGLVLLCPRTGEVHRCNPVAAALWTALGEHDGNLDRAAEVVAQRFGEPLPRVRRDTSGLVADLDAAGLVTISR